MERNNQRKINLKPVYTFLTEDTTPKDFAKLLDDFIFEHFSMISRLQKLDNDDKTIHENTEEFIHYIKLLRDILPYCENPKEEKGYF